MRYAEGAHLGSFMQVLLIMIFTLLWSCYQKFLDKKKPRFRRGLKNAFFTSVNQPPAASGYHRRKSKSMQRLLWDALFITLFKFAIIITV